MTEHQTEGYHIEGGPPHHAFVMYGGISTRDRNYCEVQGRLAALASRPAPYGTYEDALMTLFARTILNPNNMVNAQGIAPKIVRKRVTTYEPTVEILPLVTGCEGN